MSRLHTNKLRSYLLQVFKQPVKIGRISVLGEKKDLDGKKLKAIGYGTPLSVEFSAGGKQKCIVFRTVKPGPFGHEHFTDRARILLWQNSAFNALPRHVRSIDAGIFASNGSLRSVGDAEEFFIITDKVEGELYHNDLDRISAGKSLSEPDKRRCAALANYIADVHAVKREDPGIYVRQIRDLLGHGEGIMGLSDSYPKGLSYINKLGLCEIEKKCVEWRWKIRDMTKRCARVHGDFHPWNILFRKANDLSVLDRSRGEWGEPADDVSCMGINYIFYSLRTHGNLAGPFKELSHLFLDEYIKRTRDREIFKVIQPFFAWRGLVIASPIWYPDLSLSLRKKIFNFIRNVLNTKKFNLNDVNSYIKG